jgi:hypothetical protein
MRSFLQSNQAVESLLRGAFSDAVTTSAVRAQPDFLAAGEYYLPTSAIDAIRKSIAAGEARIGCGSDSQSISHQEVLANLARSQAVAVASSRGFEANLQRRRALARFGLLLGGIDASASDPTSELTPDITFRPASLIAGTDVMLLSAEG